MEPTYSSQSRRMLSDDDRHRPRYHYTSPANFLGDPNGPLLWDGRYHLFYQYNPDGAYDNSRRMHWGHAVSDDLVRWTDLPIALGPDPDGPDRLGCFSGAATVWDGVPTLVYYGNPTGICIATSADGLLTWQKHPANPVIPHSLHGGPTVFDPAIWREDGTWYCLSGGSVEGPKDAAFLFRSEDMVDWEYVGLFYERATRPTARFQISSPWATSMSCSSPATRKVSSTISASTRAAGSSRSATAG